MGILAEFRKFAARGNVIDMAVGVIVGASFGTIVKSLVDDVIMPPIGLVLGGVDFSNFFLVLKEGATPGPYAALADAKKAGAVSVNYGVFLNSIVSFLIVAFAVFMLVRAANAARKKDEPAPPAPPPTKDCPLCTMAIPVKAVRCPQCAADLPGAPA